MYMLSTSDGLQLSTILVGSVIQGCKLFPSIEFRKLSISSFFSCCNKSKLKSPEIIIFYFPF